MSVAQHIKGEKLVFVFHGEGGAAQPQQGAQLLAGQHAVAGLHRRDIPGFAAGEDLEPFFRLLSGEDGLGGQFFAQLGGGDGDSAAVPGGFFIPVAIGGGEVGKGTLPHISGVFGGFSGADGKIRRHDGLAFVGDEIPHGFFGGPGDFFTVGFVVVAPHGFHGVIGDIAQPLGGIG